MIKTGYLILLAVNSFLPGKCPTVPEARQLYKQAADNKTACNDLISGAQGCGSASDPVLTGYQAAATMMMAKYVINPFSKLSWFRKGRKLLDNTLAQHPKNIELRFLRFTIQTNAPGMLGYNSDINSDKSFLLNAVGGLTDATLQHSICDYLQQSTLLNEREKKQLQSICKK
ncbi:MAG: hypothetical protein J7621_14130 [Niastella sp.]|nr:hypothetical protein [Niastella sp.]